MLEDVLAELRACRWIDLTHAFGPGIPHFHEFPDEKRGEFQSHEEHGFQVHYYRHVGQWGTHVDPPVHFIKGGRALDELPVEEMILPLVVLDVRAEVAADDDFAATSAVVAAHESEHGPIPARSFVALLTGWGARWPDDAAMRNGGHAPGWDVDALRVLVEERGVTAIGHDTTDTDPADAHRRRRACRDVHPRAGSLADRAAGESGSRAGARRVDRRDVAEAGRRLGLSRPLLRDSAVASRAVRMRVAVCLR